MKVDQLLTVKEAAGLLKVSPQTIYAMVGRGDLAGTAVGLGRIRPRIRVFAESVQQRLKDRRI